MFSIRSVRKGLEAEESPLLADVARELLVKKQQAGRLAVAL
jgi:hypothetical protein